MGVFSACFLSWAVVGLKRRAGFRKHPRLFYVVGQKFNPFALGAYGQCSIAMAKYTRDSHITTFEEVKDFFRHIVFDLDINFHPDDDFKDYFDSTTGERSMDDEQAELYNRLMDEAFEACDDEDRVYELGSDLLKERLQMK